MNPKQKSLLSVFWLTLTLLGATGLALAALSDTPLNISYSDTDAGYPAIAVSDNGQNIGIVWANRYTGGEAVQGPIYFKSASDGATLDQRITVDNSTSTSDQSWAPDIASDPNTPGHMHVVWANLTNSGSAVITYTIYYALCATSEAACGSNANHTIIQQVNDSDQQVNDPKVTTTANGDDTIVHVVWQFIDNEALEKSIYYSAQKADGTWTTPVAVSGDNEYASHPAIAASTEGGVTYLHIAWASNTDKSSTDNEEIRYCRRAVDSEGVGPTSSAGWCGDTPTADFDAGNLSSTADHPDYPAVAAVDNVVMVLWDELNGSVEGDGWPEEETYYAAYALSEDTGSSFAAPDYIANLASTHLSDHVTTTNAEDVRGSPHARRLQPRAVALSGTSDVTATIYAVWHETTSGLPNRHDVWYSRYQLGCAECPGWVTPTGNETDGNKLGDDPDEAYYSMSPDIAVSDEHDLFVVYMEGKEEGGYDVGDSFILDVILNSTVTITDATGDGDDDDGSVYLPIILRAAS